MSLFGALQSGISGLAAQSSAMGAISDNIVNVSTVGYKDTNIAFKTLVTKQSSTSSYSTGGVQAVPRQYIDLQGLLANNTSSTALGISGDGYFVVNDHSEGKNGLWSYTRAGDFSLDDNGYMTNTGGFYAQGWSLLPWDGNPSASVVNINNINYMKGYYDEKGTIVYVNDNVIDGQNLRPINLKNIGGTASATQQLAIGANLPSGDATGTTRKVAALIYDSLGNASNLSVDFTKNSPNAWDLNIKTPSNATTVSVMTKDDKVFSASGQLEFTNIPQNGSMITITDDETGVDYTFEFTNNPAGVVAPNIAVDLSNGIYAVADFVNAFRDSISANIPAGGRFRADGDKISITQSVGGGSLTIDASKTLSCVQNGAHPNPTTGLPTGIFTISEIDNSIKNGAKFDFSSSNTASYDGQSIVIDGVNYKFTNGTTPVALPDIAVDISAATTVEGIVKSLYDVLQVNVSEPDRIVLSGVSLEINPSVTGADLALDFSAIPGVSAKFRDKTAGWTTAMTGILSNEFNVGADTFKGSKIPAIMFNSDGTPKYFNVLDAKVEWANGAKDMIGGTGNGTRIALKLGDEGTNNGLTGLSGTFTTGFIRQDGAKFGSYAGVNIDKSGVVTALFDNGELRPIAILPLATFANPRAMEALTGNTWIETGSSGQPLLKHSGDNGAGTITSNALEQSTVDLATEFSNMIVTQRAYSAAGKIMTTASDMLAELMNFVR